MLGVFAGFIIMFIVGPSAILHFGNSVWLMMVGQLLLGTMIAFVLVPALPEMISQVKDGYPME